MNAWELRDLADQTGDPELYEKAAAVFVAMDMSEAARRCQERADYYRQTEAQ